jgi:hypothetical protein
MPDALNDLMKKLQPTEPADRAPAGKIMWRIATDLVEHHSRITSQLVPGRTFDAAVSAFEGRDEAGVWWFVFKRRSGRISARTEKYPGGRGGSINLTAEAAQRLAATVPAWKSEP